MYSQISNRSLIFWHLINDGNDLCSTHHAKFVLDPNICWERGRIQLKEHVATGHFFGKDVFPFSVRGFTFHSHVLARIVHVGRGVERPGMCQVCFRRSLGPGGSSATLQRWSRVMDNKVLRIVIGQLVESNIVYLIVDSDSLRTAMKGIDGIVK
jgi:hypothetical protein